jgi:hypothetical protein
MAEDWATTVAKKIESRIADEADRTTVRRKRYEEGVEKFRKQVLDLVAAVNGKIGVEAGRIHIILLDNGFILSAAYKRIVTTEEPGVFPDIPASVGKILLQREDRKALALSEPTEVYVTQAGTQTAFYHRTGGALKQFLDPEFKQVVEYFAT